MTPYGVTFLAGAQFLASCTALYNLVQFEVSFEEQLHPFRPTWKFWGTKILVSITFFQQLVLSYCKNWLPAHLAPTEPQNNLLHSTLLSLELVCVALLHNLAWNPDDHEMNDEEDHDTEWVIPEERQFPDGVLRTWLQTVEFHRGDVQAAH